MTLSQTRDSQALRAHLEQQRSESSNQPLKSQLLPPMQETLKNWANSPTIAKSFQKPHEDKTIAVPNDPFLSNNKQSASPTLTKTKRSFSGKLPQVLHQTMRTDDRTTLEAYTFDLQHRQEKIIQGFQKYADELIVACYDDLNRDRQQIQYQLSLFEVQYQQIVDDTEKKPQALVQAIENTSLNTKQYLDNFSAQIQNRLSALKEAVKIATREAVNQLDKANLTKEQIKEALLQTTNNINVGINQVLHMTTLLMESSSARSNLMEADFAARASRVMYNRRQSAAKQLIKDFKDFIIQNEWSDPLVAQISNCNLSHQQMASNLYDMIEMISGGVRENAFKIAETFQKCRGLALASVKIFEQTLMDVSSNLESAKQQTVNALNAINMPGEDQLTTILESWKERWNKREQKLKLMSKQLIHANSYYVVGLIIIIQEIEKTKIKTTLTDKQLQLYFDQLTQSIENRFQRDSQIYNDTIAQIDTYYQKIWNTEDAILMSQIAQKLIDAMQVSMDKRSELILKYTAEQDSEFVKCIKDTLFEQLYEFASICSIQRDWVDWIGLKSDKMVDWNNDGIKIKQIDETVSEREKDVLKKQEQEQPKPTPSQPNSPSKTGAKNKDTEKKPDSKGNPVRKDPKNQPKYELNAQGLYCNLPKFSDMDQEKYKLEHGFSFNCDKIYEEQLKQQIIQLVLNDGKAAKGKKDEVVPIGTKWAEPGSQQIEILGEKETHKISLKASKDFRVMINFAILRYMQKEGARMAYNRSIDDFSDSIEKWKTDYLKILNEIQQNAFKEQNEQFQKDKKEWEKRNKGKKEQEPELVQPSTPPTITSLPENVSELINKVEIPQHKELDQSDTFLVLVYNLLPFEKIRTVPDFDAQFSLQINEVLFDEEAEKPESKAEVKRKDPKSASKDKRAPTQAETESKIPKPTKLKEFWTDSRIVTHGQANVLQSSFNNLYKVEVQKVLVKYYQMVKYYVHQGEHIRRKVAADSANLALTLLNHKMKYVQQTVQQIEVKFAQRNGITQRVMEKMTRQRQAIELQYTQADSRFNQFSIENAKNNKPDTAAVKIESPVRKPDSKGNLKKPALNAVDKQQTVANQIEPFLQKKGISQFIKISISPVNGQITKIELLDSFGQLHPTFRFCVDIYQEVFINQLIPGFQQPYLLHRQIIYAKDAFLSRVNFRFIDLIKKLNNKINNMISELLKAKEQGKVWGAEKVDYDFGFADAAYNQLISNYIPKPILEKNNTAEPQVSHPCIAIYDSLITSLTLFKEDIISRYQQDVNAFVKLINITTEGIKLQNGTQIGINEKKILAQRDTNRLCTLIVGRFSNIQLDLESVSETFKSLENLFVRQELVVEKSHLLQSSTMSASRAKAQKDANKQMVFKRIENSSQQISRLCEASLKLENCYYLLGYDRDLLQTVQKQPHKYQLAFEQFQQRQKAFNMYFSLFLAYFYTLEKITFDKIPDFKELYQTVSKYQPSKTYVSKNRIYTDQSQVDILTQFQTEYLLILQKFPNLDLSQLKQESECTTEQDWAGLSILSMGQRLGQQHRELVSETRNMILTRDNLIAQLLENINLYLNDFYKNEVQNQFIAQMNVSEDLKKDYVQKFSVLYDKVRPILSQMPEKAVILNNNCETQYKESKNQHEEIFNREINRFINQARLMQSALLVPGILYSLYPQLNQNISASMQMNMLFDLVYKQVAADVVEPKAAKKENPKDKAKEPVVESDVRQILKVFTDEQLSSFKLDSIEDSLSFYLQKSLKLLQSGMDKFSVLFNLDELDPKQLTAPIQAKSNTFLYSQITPKPLELLKDPETLNLTRSADDDRPLSRADTKKVPPKDKDKQDETAMPTCPMVPLVLLPIQFSDENIVKKLSSISENKFRTKAQTAVSADKLSANYFNVSANEAFNVLDCISGQIEQYHKKGLEISALMDRVKNEFTEAVKKAQGK
ncbi:Conserved_hypothetical protein [Hexamita inflata]|uniref:Uncharacterized protein n=1 Tax=Hexamita inflata TaxID=28002 RepID=A0AA86P2T5_9EUKA|nr:Conserved hypothetical protein [Hexamita inflata]